MTKLISIFATIFAFQVQAQDNEAPPANPVPPAATAPADATTQREAIVNTRQENQDKRIDQGVQSGALTEKEAHRMDKREQHIQKMEDRAMSDGKMTGKEFRKIERAQNRTNRAIYKAKHNRRGN